MADHINLEQLLNFDDAFVTIVGDLMLDRYWHGNTGRISPEAPVPVVHVQQNEERPGGAGNVALNVSALGAKARVFGICGIDAEGDILETKLNNADIDCFFHKTDECPTTLKLRILSQHQQLIRLDFEQRLSKQAAQNLYDSVGQTQRFDQGKHVMVLSDYNKGTLQSPTEWIAFARKHNVPVLVDPKGRDFNRYRGAHILTPNYSEFEGVVGTCQTESEIVEKGMNAIAEHDLQALLITRGKNGMTLLTRDHSPTHLPAHAKDVFDVTGAGDTVIASLAVGFASGMSLLDATRLANVAASISVGKLGASTVSVPELRRTLTNMRNDQTGILNQQQLVMTVEDAKAHGEKIIMTNGCFDILHAGHVSYLQQAKALGDRLIVAVNDDASVSRLKGDSRPINTLARRMALLSELNSVDWVVSFDQDTPADLIEAVSPHMLVKGGDYTVDQIPGSDHVMATGGDVKVLDFVDDLSTTNLLNKLIATEVSATEDNSQTETVT